MRTLPRICVALALGAITTTVVAWTCAMATPSSAASYTTLNINEHGAQPARSLNIQVDKRPGRSLIQLRIQYSLSPAYEDWRMTPELRRDIEEAMGSFPETRGEASEGLRAMYDAMGTGQNSWPQWPAWLPDIPPSPSGLATYSARAAGWPLPAFRSTARSPDPAVPATWRCSWRLLTVDHYDHPADPQMGAVPLAPVPPGFAIDTLLFTTAWWLIAAGPRDVRRWWRRRQARCERCGYSLIGLGDATVCPECGEPTPESTRRPGASFRSAR
jgi:hypothetical protein